MVRQKKSSPVLEMIAPRVEEILAEWRTRTTAKQRITGTRIHRQLLEEGYEVGFTTVRNVAVRAHRATGSPRHSTTHERVVTAAEGWL